MTLGEKVIAIHDADKTRFPNLALMKLSSYYKRKGYKVEWYSPLLSDKYYKIFSSKVFTFTKQSGILPTRTKMGGIGYGIYTNLKKEIEHICPDYSMYGINYSMGFLTRGCLRKCPWCFVPKKEGKIRAHADIEEFAIHKKVILMDNNVLAHPHGIEQIEKIARLELRIDFNQGLDARLIDDKVAKLLSKVKWAWPLRLACDSKAQMKPLKKAVLTLRKHHVKPERYNCYVLAIEEEDTLERIQLLRELNVEPYVQPYINPVGDDPPFKLKLIARWANHKPSYRRFLNYADYKEKVLHQQKGGPM